MALPDLLAGRIFNVLFRKVFAEELEPRSHDMVDRMRIYTQSILQKLFEDECQAFPVLLHEVKTSLAKEFMDSKAEQTMDAVSNVVKAELGSVFTQDSACTTTIANVRDMVRLGVADAYASANGHWRSAAVPKAAGVGGLPEAFIKKMVATANAKEQDIRHLQAHHFLVDSLWDELAPWMQEKATRSDLAAWFAEDPSTIRRRKEIAHKLSQFRQAVKILVVASSME